MYVLASSSSLLTVQFLIACTMQKWSDLHTANDQKWDGIKAWEEAIIRVPSLNSFVFTLSPLSSLPTLSLPFLSFFSSYLLSPSILPFLPLLDMLYISVSKCTEQNCTELHTWEHLHTGGIEPWDHIYHSCDCQHQQWRRTCS